MLFSLFHPFLKIFVLFHNLLVTWLPHGKFEKEKTQLRAQIILVKLQRDAHMADVKFEFCKPLTYLRLRQNINKADICPVFFGQLFQAKFEELYSLFFLQRY